MLKKVLIVLGLLLVLIVSLIYLSVDSTDKQFDTCEIVGDMDMDTILFKNYKTVKLQASELYKANFLKSIIQGENYREAWSTTVDVPILFLDTLKGGVRIVKEGGGKQTQSLRLEASDGTLYTLRSINKNPKQLIPKFAKTLGLENIVVDGISSQHPYAAPVVARLAESAMILHTHPTIVFVPKQERLRTFNMVYGNRLYMLEYETEGRVNWTNLPDIVELVDTERLQALKVAHGKALTIDKSALIRARLFDMVIGDWDRHAKQWGWAVQARDSTFKAIPIPGDRDNAFFLIDGILPTLISNKYAVKEVRPFDKEIDFMDGLVYDFDVYFLQNTDKSIFLEQAKALQQTLTDAAIYNALSTWNEALYQLDASVIFSKITARRDNLIDIADRFKTTIDKRPLLSDPLKGSDDEITNGLIQCFDCL